MRSIYVFLVGVLLLSNQYDSYAQYALFEKGATVIVDSLSLDYTPQEQERLTNKIKDRFQEVKFICTFEKDYGVISLGLPYRDIERNLFRMTKEYYSYKKRNFVNVELNSVTFLDGSVVEVGQDYIPTKDMSNKVNLNTRKPISKEVLDKMEDNVLKSGQYLKASYGVAVSKGIKAVRFNINAIVPMYKTYVLGNKKTYVDSFIGKLWVVDRTNTEVKIARLDNDYYDHEIYGITDDGRMLIGEEISRAFTNMETIKWSNKYVGVFIEEVKFKEEVKTVLIKITDMNGKPLSFTIDRFSNALVDENALD